MSGSGISLATCKSAPSSRQTTTPAPHHSVFYRPDALPAAQPTASKHWKQHLHQYHTRTAAVALISCRLQKLLQITALWCQTLYCTSCSLCRMPLHNWSLERDALITSRRFTRTPLATHPRVRQVQSGMLGSPVTVRAGASLLGQRLPSRVRQHSALSAVSWRFDLRGAANIQQLCRQNFCSRQTSPVELSSSPPA